MENQLTCEKMIRIDDGHDCQGRALFYHRKCGQPAAVREYGGQLTVAKAILCDQHAKLAEWETFVSSRGWPQGKVEKDPRTGRPTVQQERCKPAVSE